MNVIFKWKGNKKCICYVGSMNVGFVRIGGTNYQNKPWFDWFSRLDHPEMKQWRPGQYSIDEAKKRVEECFIHWFNETFNGL